MLLSSKSSHFLSEKNQNRPSKDRKHYGKLLSKIVQIFLVLVFLHLHFVGNGKNKLNAAAASGENHIQGWFC